MNWMTETRREWPAARAMIPMAAEVLPLPLPEKTTTNPLHGGLFAFTLLIMAEIPL